MSKVEMHKGEPKKQALPRKKPAVVIPDTWIKK
jgi:hypothetical protein